MKCPERADLAAAYAAMYDGLRHEAAFSAAESEALPSAPGADELLCSWMSGELGCAGETLHHGSLRVFDFGVWNRAEGPDCLGAELELDGRRLRGDVVLTRRAEDWEERGCGCDAAFEGVALHVVAEPPPPGWFTRNLRHAEVPLLVLDELELRRALGYPSPWSVEGLDCGPAPLRGLSGGQVRALLLAAAARRMQLRRGLFRRRAERLGEDQAWFECWAETLGYRVNKLAMRMLARRAPLHELEKLGDDAEAVLFGTAGFLEAVLPERAGEEARAYHRRVWDGWWPRSERYRLADSRSLLWMFSSVRPLNHPHRRVAALAVTAARWAELRPLMTAEQAPALLGKLAGLRHDYWSRHCSLPSETLKSAFALVGRERIKDFIVNHVCVQDDSEASWRMYLRLRVHSVPTRVQRAAQALLGDRADLPELLRHCYAQQGLLQLDDDFGRASTGASGRFPSALAGWRLSL